MGNICSSHVDTTNPLYIDSQPATCYITIESYKHHVGET
jgi:hypothetical protein